VISHAVFFQNFDKLTALVKLFENNPYQKLMTKVNRRHNANPDDVAEL
jgi:hypothetical protein